MDCRSLITRRGLAPGAVRILKSWLSKVSRELPQNHQSMLEVKTDICRDVEEVEKDLLTRYGAYEILQIL